MAVVFVCLLFLVTSKFGQSYNITTEPRSVQAMFMQNVTLDCRVNTQELNDIIRHPVNWKHVSNSGLSRLLSQAFYKIVNDSRFILQFGNANGSATDYSFKLGILGVMDEDDGRFVCEHKINDSTSITNEVPFTVLHGIDYVTLEVRIANKTLTSNRTLQPREPSAYETEAKSLQVTCLVNGSNPEPLVSLRVDGTNLTVQTQATQRLVGVRRAYDVKVVQNISLAIHQDKSVVDITCEAQHPDNRFQPRSAGIRLDVQPGISAVCEKQEGKKVGDNVTIDCIISANRTVLDCSKVTVTNATGNEVLTKEGVDSENPNLGRMRFICDGSNTTRLRVVITVNSLTEVYFSTGLYLRYSNGEETTTTKLKFISKESPIRAECDKVFTIIGMRDLIVVCNVTTPDCSSIRWEGKWEMSYLGYMEKRTDVELGVLESSCKVLEGNKTLQAYLKISEVKSATFEANISISYNNGVKVERMPIQIEQIKITSSHGNPGSMLSARVIMLAILCTLLLVVI